MKTEIPSCKNKTVAKAMYWVRHLNCLSITTDCFRPKPELRCSKVYTKTRCNWSKELPGTEEFLRTPNAYGYYTLTWPPTEKFKTALSGIYTGKMLVPHYGVPGNAGTPENEILFESHDFMETNLKISYTINSRRLDSSIEFFGGVGNMFNQYQNDFDSGKYRDSGYIYGSAKPRNFYVGIKIFN